MVAPGMDLPVMDMAIRKQAAAYMAVLAVSRLIMVRQSI